jgi:hypothetical protein
MQNRLFNLLLEVKMHGVDWSFYNSNKPVMSAGKAAIKMNTNRDPKVFPKVTGSQAMQWLKPGDKTVAGQSLNIGNPTVLLNKGHKDYETPAYRRNVLAHEGFHAKLKNSPNAGKVSKWLGSRESLAHIVGGWRQERPAKTGIGRLKQVPKRVASAVGKDGLGMYLKSIRQGHYKNSLTGQLINKIRRK